MVAGKKAIVRPCASIARTEVSDLSTMTRAALGRPGCTDSSCTISRQVTGLAAEAAAGGAMFDAIDATPRTFGTQIGVPGLRKSTPGLSFLRNSGVVWNFSASASSTDV